MVEYCDKCGRVKSMQTPEGAKCYCEMTNASERTCPGCGKLERDCICSLNEEGRLTAEKAARWLFQVGKVCKRAPGICAEPDGHHGPCKTLEGFPFDPEAPEC